MTNGELVSYIKDSRNKKTNDASIVEALKRVGWQEGQITRAFAEVDGIPLPSNSNVEVPLPSQKSQISHSLWDIFETLLMFISLYVLSIAIGLLLHNFVDQIAPNKIDYYYSNDSLVKGYISSIIVSLPLFTFFFKKTTKRLIQNPALKDLVQRKLLIYLTLVVTFIITIANVISLVYKVLSDSFDLNFVLHFIVTVSISGVIFYYYSRQVKEGSEVQK